MKTAKSFAQKSRVVMALIILISALLFLASCKKEEMEQPLSAPTASVNASQNNQYDNRIALVFSFIRIDHQTMETGKPDYYVTVASDGTVNYEGRKNVFVKRLVIWKATSDEMNAINQLCLEFTSSITRSSIVNSENRVPVLDQVITTYIPVDLITQTYIDFDNNIPEKLVKFRTKVEEVLHIAKLTKGNTVISNATVEQ